MRNALRALAGVAASAFVVLLLSWILGSGFASSYQAANIQEWAALPPQFAATSRCQACHSSVYAVWAAAKHKAVNCQNCHGPAAAHIEDRVKPDVDRSREGCGFCHGQVLGRRMDFPRVNMGQHGRGAACVECHDPHAATFDLLKKETKGP